MDLKVVDMAICEHTTPMKEDAKLSRQHPYTYNLNFTKKIKEEIDNLNKVEFIYEIKHTHWISPIVVVSKKNGKLRVCINLKKVNVAIIRDNYPLQIIDHVIEQVVRKETYSFLHGFLGYNHIWINPKDKHKMAFTT